MPKKVILRDVADLAKVALGTASLALRGKEGVLDETRDRVIQAAKELGYDRRFQFSESQQKRIARIGVIKHNHYDGQGHDSFYFPVIVGIEQECAANGLSMVYTTIEVDDWNRALRLNTNITHGEFDGMLVVGMYLNRAISDQFHAAQCPVVLVDGYSEVNRWDRVLMNNFDGAFRAVTFLIEKGHRCIGLIGTSETCYPSIMERREGYIYALRKHGNLQPYMTEGLLSREGGYEATLALLAAHPEITGIFVANDNAAIGVINAAREIGREVPRDLSVIGFDDITFSRDMVPPLSTMHVDKLEMGKLALRRLLYRNEYKDAPVTTTLIDTLLLVRKSVRAISSMRAE